MSSSRPEDEYASLAQKAWGTTPTPKLAKYKPRTKTTGNPEYDKLYDEKGKQYDVDPDLLIAQGSTESGFNPRAVSPKGAQGLAQFIPATAKEFGVNVKDPASSVDGQSRMMRGERDNNIVTVLRDCWSTDSGRIRPRRTPQHYLSRVLSRRACPAIANSC